MAERIYQVDINLSKQELRNARVQNLATPPSATVGSDKGLIYYNNAEDVLYLWIGDQWIDISQIYEHPEYLGSQKPNTDLTGATVVTAITLENGHVTGVKTRNMTPDDINAAWKDHTHKPADIIGLPVNTILGNVSDAQNHATPLTVSQVLIMLGLSAGTMADLTAGTITSQKTWSPKVIADYVTSKIGDFLTEVHLGTTYTTTSVVVTNTAGDNASINSATGTSAGVMSVADKKKLDAIEDGANKYIHPKNNPGSHPFATEITSGLQILSQLVVNEEGHTISIKGRNLTAADLAVVIFNNSVNNGTNTTWTSSKIYQEIQNALAQASTGALQYKGDYDPITNTPNIILPATGVKQGWTYVVSKDGMFVGQEVEAGDMIIAKSDNPLDNPNNWQIVNKNIPAILDASTTVKGIVQLATNAEAIAGTNTTKAVTPAGLKAVLDNMVGGYVANFGNGSDTSFVITHGQGTQDVVIVVQRVSDRAVIEVDAKATSATTVTLNMNIAPANNAYRVIIKK